MCESWEVWHNSSMDCLSNCLSIISSRFYISLNVNLLNLSDQFVHRYPKSINVTGWVCKFFFYLWKIFIGGRNGLNFHVITATLKHVSVCQGKRTFYIKKNNINAMKSPLLVYHFPSYHFPSSFCGSRCKRLKQNRTNIIPVTSVPRSKISAQRKGCGRGNILFLQQYLHQLLQTHPYKKPRHGLSPRWYTHKLSSLLHP